LTGVDADYGLNPRESATLLNWNDQEGNVKKMPICDFLKESWLFMTVDTSWTSTGDSDFKVCTVMAATPENELFVLDIWGAQCDENTLIKNIFQIADRWRVPSIHPEVVRQSIALYQNLDSLVKQRATEMFGVAHMPKIVPLKVGMISKSARIGALQFRFENGLIKFPLERRMDRHWTNLFDQIEQFNPEVADGGLAKDDHLDTLSMSGNILKGRIMRNPEDIQDDRTTEEKMLDGELTDDSGTPLAYKLDSISPGFVNELLTRASEGPETGPSRV
jgi:phage terminase large subunit-like protein